MKDVPRDENNWPTIAPSEFTDGQLWAEVDKWKHHYGNLGTVGRAEYDKYADELIRRAVASIKERILSGNNRTEWKACNNAQLSFVGGIVVNGLIMFYPPYYLIGLGVNILLVCLLWAEIFRNRN